MRSMRQIAAVVALVVPLSGCKACDNLTGKSDIEDNDVNVTVIVGQPQPSASPGEPVPGCAAVDRVRMTLANGAQQVRVGSAANVDVTPVDADGEVLDAKCHGSQVTWEDPRGTALCKLIGDASAFRRGLLCTAGGDIEVCATVSSPGGRGCAPFPVV